MTPPNLWQIVLILVIVLLLFGGKKIPELAKGLGSGIKNFKKAVKEDDESTTNKEEISQVGETSQIKQTQATESTTQNKADS
ncbi:twin-arginine translocase TatA/TatE family subunit [Helicobacter cinaedi]|uniref:twin-arginine translocase TatA/TatE family subunit n=3 Tax=Helicobacter cinaedi TaxID=213 RepID=UPI000CF14033|nr:twin-arginine translocase TatA/TatE family subunit [Helicobacter cinaedi]AWK62459.1 twin-arginine translocase TatA/TatE family subunit [Helicobacter cinaedi]QOQ96905.1 twin-arginine translocase TatA/TatE family subunit [Helicobacter cinaedi]BBB20925.1 twin-arginine translocation protein TatA [Helicobacter cinaedi]